MPKSLSCKAVALLGRASVALLLAACRADSASGPPADGQLAVGTWGGDGVGVLVTDTLAHVHIGCTYGDLVGRVTLDADGRFVRTGSFLLRAYPIAIGPTMPAQFVGRVSGTTLTITVTVQDTINRQTVVRGPATVQFGIEPKMSNCPICRAPGERSTAVNPPAIPRWFDGIRRRLARLPN